MGYRVSLERFEEIKHILDKLPDLEINEQIKVTHPDPEQLKRTRTTVYEWFAYKGVKTAFRIKTLHPREFVILRIGIDTTKLVATRSEADPELDVIIQAIIATDDPLATVKRMQEEKQLEPEKLDQIEKHIRRIFE